MAKRGRPKREREESKRRGLLLTDNEWSAYARAADDRGMQRAEWMRAVLNRAARRKPKSQKEIHMFEAHGVGYSLNVLTGPTEGFVCHITDPLGRRCRVTRVKDSERSAHAAAQRWIATAVAERSSKSSRAYRWQPDPEGLLPKGFVCCEDTRLGFRTVLE